MALLGFGVGRRWSAAWFEQKFKFGTFFKNNQIDDLNNIIEQSIVNFNENNDEIDKFIDKNFFNYNKTSDFINENIVNILR